MSYLGCHSLRNKEFIVCQAHCIQGASEKHCQTGHICTDVGLFYVPGRFSVLYVDAEGGTGQPS